MRDPHVRFCERHGGVISRAYSTRATRCRPNRRRFALAKRGLRRPPGPAQTAHKPRRGAGTGPPDLSGAVGGGWYDA